MSTNFQDALSISSFAYRYGVPIFLEQGESEGRELPRESVERIKQLSGSALAGINGGVVLLVNGNRDLDWYRNVTVRAWDSQGTRAFLRSYGEQAQRAYLVGGTYVMPYCAAADVADVLGS